MSKIIRTALVHYSTTEMYEIVNDVDAYHTFLPWCSSSSVIESNDQSMTASIEINKGVLKSKFTTQNTLVRNSRIEISLVDGPFSVLHGVWKFDSLKNTNACKVSLDLEFEFDSTLVSIAAKPIFFHIASSLVNAFCKRAEEVYGERH